MCVWGGGGGCNTNELFNRFLHPLRNIYQTNEWIIVMRDNHRTVCVCVCVCMCVCVCVIGKFAIRVCKLIKK